MDDEIPRAAWSAASGRTGLEQLVARYLDHDPSDWTKAEIIRRGVELGVDYGVTWSCYAPRWTSFSSEASASPPAAPAACGECDSCLLRKKGFTEAGVPDPTRYYEEGS